MAYDPNDPADKAIVEGLINTALEAERESHEAEVTRLNNKNTELLGKLNKARTNGGGDSTEEISRLERQLEDAGKELASANSNLRETTRKLKAAEGERDQFKTQAETESNYSRNLKVNNDLTDALTEAKVAPHFMEAARALLKDKVKVEVNGDERTTIADGKPVADFVKTWAASDAGKHYVTAPANGGGDARGPNGAVIPDGSKKLADMSQDERLNMARTNPDAWKALLASEGPKENIAA